MNQHTHDDFEQDYLPGLPEKLPEGETILWQGAPDRASFLRHVLKARVIGFYFALVLVWNVGTAIYDGKAIAQVAISGLVTLALAGLVWAMGWWFARAVARSTIYTITSKRVVMRFGVALPVTFNFPFSQIVSADIKPLSDGTGTISLGLKEHTKISWLVLWPHARPWQASKPQPSLRAIADVDTIAQQLTKALQSAHGQPVRTVPIAAQGVKVRTYTPKPGALAPGHAQSA
ncbi:MAG: photosynthetic complex putative assembly protein PuhB [Pseudomonadota bacterium]